MDAEGITFHLFRKEYAFSWKELSLYLGFTINCRLDFTNITASFNKHVFWTTITRKDVFRQARVSRALG